MKNLNKLIQSIKFYFFKAKIRKNKIIFIPSRKIFRDILGLYRDNTYQISIQTKDGKWYYDGILWFGMNFSDFRIRIGTGDNTFYCSNETYENQIAYITFQNFELNQRLYKYVSDNNDNTSIRSILSNSNDIRI